MNWRCRPAAEGRDFSGLVIKRDDLIGDIERSNNFEWHYRLDRIDQPVDRNEWAITPPTVNAYYAPKLNGKEAPALGQLFVIISAMPVNMCWLSLGWALCDEDAHFGVRCFRFGKRQVAPLRES